MHGHLNIKFQNVFASTLHHFRSINYIHLTLKKKKPVQGHTFIGKQSKRKITEKNYMAECLESRCSYSTSFFKSVDRKVTRISVLVYMVKENDRSRDS